MNKTMLSTALLTILCTTGYADTAVNPAATPATTNAIVLPSGLPEAPAANNTVAQPAPAAAKPPAVIDCKYRISADTTTIEPSTIKTWAQKAAVQSFNFNPTTIDDELGQLKPCYTDQGWLGFNDALQKSGNITAIKSQHLTVSSQVDGELNVNPSKDNQWKVTVPLQVVYQNDKEKLTQLLNVDLLIGRKISGDLGIIQMIASPRDSAASGQKTVAPEVQQTTPATNNQATPEATTPSTTGKPAETKTLTTPPTTNESTSSAATSNQPAQQQTTHP